jgi:uncharacterized protein
MVKSDFYVPRTYRNWVKCKDLVSFNVICKETDLYIRASTNLENRACKLVLKYRKSLENYIMRNPVFQSSLEPISAGDDTPLIARAMIEASAKTGVGPMAAVAGAIAEFVGKELLAYTPELIIENGGDIFLKSLKRRVVGVFAGSSPLTGKIGLEIKADETPIGICTSSGTVGHSLSFGKADAAITLAKSATFADAAATAIGNIVNGPGDIEKAIEYAKSLGELKGLLVIIEDKIGVWGNVSICDIA